MISVHVDIQVDVDVHVQVQRLDWQSATHLVHKVSLLEQIILTGFGMLLCV